MSYIVHNGKSYGGGGSASGAGIDDISTSPKTTWSSEKINTELDKKVNITDIPTSYTPVGDNLLINPDFKINQRNATGTIEPQIDSNGIPKRTYFVDRWSIDYGSVTINADGSLTLNGMISQILENSIGNNFTASIDLKPSGGVMPLVDCRYNDSTRRFTITGDGVIIKWAKLEIGNRATDFVPPNITTELLKCQRYYEVVDVFKDVRYGYAYNGDTKHFLFTHKFQPKYRQPHLTHDDFLNESVHGEGINNELKINTYYIGVDYNSTNVVYFIVTLPDYLTSQICYVDERIQQKKIYLDAEIY